MRSDCPVSYGLDLFGDKWTLLIIRDMVFDRKRFYKDFLGGKEGIATNILSDRLKKLEENGMVASSVYEIKKTQKVYRLTEKGKALIPVLLEIMVWSFEHNNELNVPLKLIEKIRNDKNSVVDYFRNLIDESQD